MSDRAKDFMSAVWGLRNNGVDTEEKLVSAILFLAAETVMSYMAHNDLIVLDKDDLIQLAEEIKDETD